MTPTFLCLPPSLHPPSDRMRGRRAAPDRHLGCCCFAALPRSLKSQQGRPVRFQEDKTVIPAGQPQAMPPPTNLSTDPASTLPPIPRPDGSLPRSPFRRNPTHRTILRADPNKLSFPMLVATRTPCGQTVKPIPPKGPLLRNRPPTNQPRRLISSAQLKEISASGQSDPSLQGVWLVMEPRPQLPYPVTRSHGHRKLNRRTMSAAAMMMTL